ncbi:MAG: hypothetical protein MJ050_06650 [Phascolarctobacterium sp.]|nr:hypothetical protein [Phascolarctobacterium sp.]
MRLSRDMYKKIKTMNREGMEIFLNNIYEDGLKHSEAKELDLEAIRERIGAIKGIGEKRLEEIMKIIAEG